MPGHPAMKMPDDYPPVDGSQPCASIGVDEFYPERGGHAAAAAAAAAAACHRCDFELQCLTYAVRHQETSGVWGGTTPDEREQLARDMGLPFSANVFAVVPYAGPQPGDRPEEFIPPGGTDEYDEPIRVWATANGHPLTSQDHIPVDIRRAYEWAHRRSDEDVAS